MDAEMRRRRDLFPSEEDDLDERKSSASRVIDFDELLRAGTQAIVTAAPGSGKTTLRRHLALRSLDRVLPVFLELKTVHETDFDRSRNSLWMAWTR